MSPTGAHLIGSPVGRRARRDHEVESRTNEDNAQLRAAILEALQAGPVEKWRLCELVHAEGFHVLRELVRLRKAKLVTRIDLRRRAKWALTTWKPSLVERIQQATPPRPAPAPNKISITPKPNPPTTSWWVGVEREKFPAAIAERQEQMHASKIALSVNPVSR